MAMDEKKLAKLEELIQSTWPSTGPDPDYPFKQYVFPARSLAVMILGASEVLPLEYGKFIDKEPIEKLIPALKKLLKQLGRISGQGALELKLHADMLQYSSDREEPFDEFSDYARRLLRSAEYIANKNSGLKPPHGGTNWRAISVLDVCSEIWHQETGEKAPRINAETQHSSPFGKFINHVFRILGIGAQPRVAQDKLRQWQQDEAQST
ncbi:hypothetical protein [Roseovarius sp.]|uniref:hypothetical protein n=1 Tax=Roseovarius sp. TaxID=1486281 RepID=UPI003BAA219F